VDKTETWQEHFWGTGDVSNPQYAGPSAIITAGYHYFILAESSATYYQQWDLGAEQANATVTLITTAQDYGPTTSDAGTVTGPPEIFISTGNAAAQLALYDLDADDTTGWVSKGTGNNSVLGKDFRFVKIKIPYTSGTGAFKKITQQRMTLNLATIRDQSLGPVTVSTLSGTPSNGKRVTFNKTFQDITSIMVTPIFKSSGNQNTAIYDFTDVANPTEFDVYLLDATDGSFALGDFTWQATGV
jgi:hypothetical protein